MKTSFRQAGAFLVLMSFLVVACDQQVEPDPTLSVESIQLTAEIEILSGDLEAAIQTWEQVLEDEPENESAHFHMALILLIQDPDAALIHIEEAESANPDLARQASRLKAAIRQATAIEDHSYQLTIAGQALSSLEEWALAEIALDLAVGVNSEYAEAWAYLGEARQQNGSPGGYEALRTAYAINPQSFSVNLLTSIYYRRSEKPHLAIPYLKAALSLEPNNLDLHADLAQTMIDAGQVHQGFEYLQTLADTDPTSEVVWLKLAQLSVENNLQVADDGLAAARQAVVLEPDNAQAVLTLGRAYLLLDQPVLAERFLLQASDLDPLLADPHYFLGLLFLNNREYSSAKSELNSALILAESSGQDLFVEQIKTLIGEYFP